MRANLIAISVALCLSGATSRAQTSPPAGAPAPPPAAPSELAIQAYGDREKTCVAWTDGCRNCARAENDAISCSNIGIACQPAEITCSARRAK
ncbi:MAG TPA: hypothetical protein VKX28_29040 [Xanthobacteraceae bacterium]|jgi:hypothetical protein|nr:hypothetical protein [Xanthobacteraceae bacterium]